MSRRGGDRMSRRGGDRTGPARDVEGVSEEDEVCEGARVEEFTPHPSPEEP